LRSVRNLISVPPERLLSDRLATLTWASIHAVVRIAIEILQLVNECQPPLLSTLLEDSFPTGAD
jgi:hypothetical protein